MSDHDNFPEEEILERLRAADPAAGARTDLTRLRSAVDSRIAGGSVPGDDGGAIVTALAPARSRRPLLAVAAAAAGALAIAAGGFAAGRGTVEPGPTAGPAGGLESSADGSATAPGVPESGVTAGTDAASYPAPTISRMDFHAVGLSEEAGTAPAWTYDPATSFSAERTAALGGHLGMPGEPTLAGGAWQMGVTDGSGAYLTVSPDGTTTTSYYDPAKDPHQCLRTESGGSGAAGQPAAPDAPEGGAAGGAPTYEWCEPTGADPAPRGEDAFVQARELLAAAGLDPAGFELVDSDYGDPSVTEVVAHQLVDGQRTGVAWYVAVTAAGVQSFNGSLAPLTALGDYPVISAAAAVDRLEDPRFGTFGEVHILSPAEGRPADTAGEPAAGAGESAAAGDIPVTSGPAGQDGPPPAATPGSPVPWPVEVVAITGAKLGPALWTAPSGTALLVPAYELSADDGRTWSVVAVAEEALDLTP
ncbi:hypothetical protein [Georgenia daeguensis]|uniref:Uncharacterized protein n=1 Tax=Georgenia daeguensis TaxID=908355 RepID=A0ABP8ENV0_9MICO